MRLRLFATHPAWYTLCIVERAALAVAGWADYRLTYTREARRAKTTSGGKVL